jgi:hypothetical protein
MTELREVNEWRVYAEAAMMNNSRTSYAGANVLMTTGTLSNAKKSYGEMDGMDPVLSEVVVHGPYE